ncbi:MAG: ATP-binding protein [Desulfovibrio sp.]|nr:ATP-binding protein [Desulfovibrio sp.]
MNISVSNLQNALKAATENLPIAAETNETPTPAGVFTPPSHIRALRPQALLVIGARGVGKTFWTQALRQEDIRKVLQQDIPELADVRVTIGYTNKANPDAYPSSRQFSSLIKKYDAADIWRTVLVRAVASQQEVAPFSPFQFRSWEEHVADVSNNPESVDRFLYEANKVLATTGTRILVLFDALDRVADSWNAIDALTTALLRTTLQLSTYSHIKGKVFLREDHYNRLAITFPDASKLCATRVELSWKRAELYGLLWKHLCNSAGQSGQLLRDLFERYIGGGLVNEMNIWLFSRTVNLSDDTLRPLFHALTGSYMGKDKRRGIPYVWTVGHLADARQQTSPRSFMAAICRACEDSRENHASAEYAIHYESIKCGVQYASEIRVAEMQEDNPWAENLLTLLKGRTVPCPFQDVQALWEEKYPHGPGMLIDSYPEHTPPEFAKQRWQDVREKLERLGFCMKLEDGRFNMPDLYRVGFRLGRRGGVKPLP